MMRVWAALALCALGHAVELELEMEAGSTRCLGEDVGRGQVMLVEVTGTGPFSATLTDDTDEAVAAIEQDPTLETEDGGIVLFRERETMSAKHAANTARDGVHTLCVSSTRANRLKLALRWGAEARDFSRVARLTDLERAKQSLRQTEHLLHQYKHRVAQLKHKEEKLQANTQHIKNTMVGLFCANCALFIAGAGLQAYYFLTFFRSKKII